LCCVFSGARIGASRAARTDNTNVNPRAVCEFISDTSHHIGPEALPPLLSLTLEGGKSKLFVASLKWNKIARDRAANWSTGWQVKTEFLLLVCRFTSLFPRIAEVIHAG
jgi:hypothetical protein